MTTPTPTHLAEIAASLRTFGLGLPGTTEDFPWGERVLKVNKKVFVFMGMAADDSGLGMSVKLPESAEKVLEFPFATPTGYGLGKSGWVSVKFTPGDRPDAAMLQAWVLESYRAVAPKKLAAAVAGL